MPQRSKWHAFLYMKVIIPGRGNFARWRVFCKGSYERALSGHEVGVVKRKILLIGIGAGNPDYVKHP